MDKAFNFLSLTVVVLTFSFTVGCNSDDAALYAVPSSQADTILVSDLNEELTPLDAVGDDAQPLHDVAKDSINYTDAERKKQGEWIARDYKDDIISIHNYQDDVLHGYWFEWRGMQEDGYYADGRKEGYFRTYYGDKADDKVMSIRYYKNDTLIWAGFPQADADYLIPVKGFKLERDSVFVSAPHSNGKRWYTGLFVHGKEVGVHHMFHNNGELRGSVNYDTQTIFITDSTDQKVRKIRNWPIEYIHVDD